MPGTLDSATHTFLAVHFSCPFLESGSGARQRGGQLILPVSPAGGTRSSLAVVPPGTVLPLRLRLKFFASTGVACCGRGSSLVHGSTFEFMESTA